VGLRDRRLAAVIRRCQDLPGQDLFQYLDERGQPHDIASDDVNAYLRTAAGADVTASDFRIWAATVLAYRALAASEPAAGPRAAKRLVLDAVRITAAELGNTEAVARSSYVHPGVLDACRDGASRPRARGRATAARLSASDVDRAAEAAVVDLLASLEKPST
jgi:DNA topoisomerase-1